METRFGPFQGSARLGEGAVGEVWRAVHEATGDVVAVKRLRPEHGAKWRSLMRREVEAVARLDHPGVVWIHDHGVAEDGAPWIALELASGGSFEGRPFRDWGSVWQSLEEVLPALQHAHARGVLHRDLKPANLLLCTLDDPRPGPKLCDFSISSIAGARGPLGGTPDYLAPEQRDGRFDDEGPWTDLYALGGLAWTFVCGAPPTQTPWAPRFPVPRELRDWVEELRAPRTRDRFPSAAAARRALSGFGSAPVGEVRSARTFDGPTGQHRRHPKRMPASLALLGLRPAPTAGRVEERRTLSRVSQGLASAAPDCPRVVRLTGPSGFGKSHLARWLAVAAREHDDVDVVEWGRRGEHFVAGLLEVARRPGSPEVADGDDPLATLLAWVRVARRPLLLIADPWDGDVPLLRAAAASPPGRLAVVATTRDGGEVLRGVLDVPLAPHPDPGAVARSLGVGDASLLEAIALCSFGNPGAAVGLVRDLASRGDLVEGRTGWTLRPGVPSPVPVDAADLVPDADRPALSMLALLGGVATLDEWFAACAAIGVACDAQTADRYRRSGLVVDDDHPRLVDEVVAGSLRHAAERSPAWSRAAAEVLHDDRDPRQWSSVGRVERAAVLLCLCGETARALPLLSYAGIALDGLLERGMWILARAEDAAAAFPPGERETLLQTVRRNRAIVYSNHGYHVEAAAAILALDDPTPRGQRVKAAILLRAGYPHRALRPAREAVRTLEPGREADIARGELARILLEIGRVDEALQLSTDDSRVSVMNRTFGLTLADDLEAVAALFAAMDEPPGLEDRMTVEVGRLNNNVERGVAGWVEAQAMWDDPRSYLSQHIRVSCAGVRLLAAARTQPQELARAEADLREELSANPSRSTGLRRTLLLAAAATTGELAQRIEDLAATQLPLDGPDDLCGE